MSILLGIALSVLLVGVGFILGIVFSFLGGTRNPVSRLKSKLGDVFHTESVTVMSPSEKARIRRELEAMTRDGNQGY